MSDGDACNSAMLYNNEGPIGAVYYSPESREAEFIPMNVLTAGGLSVSIIQHLFIGNLYVLPSRLTKFTDFYFQSRLNVLILSFFSKRRLVEMRIHVYIPEISYTKLFLISDDASNTIKDLTAKHETAVAFARIEDKKDHSIRSYELSMTYSLVAGISSNTSDPCCSFNHCTLRLSFMKSVYAQRRPSTPTCSAFRFRASIWAQDVRLKEYRSVVCVAMYVKTLVAPL